jgi:hydroxyacylglutathione hydrolase
MSGFSLTVIPNNDDNFCYYLFAPGQESSGVLVDVGEATPVLAFCEARGISPSAILSTHKHWDHTGGNSELAQRFEGLQIVGGENDEVTGCTTPVSNDHTLEIAGLKVKCHHTPCHTTGHILYFVTGGDLDESQTHEKAILEGFVNVSHINAGVFTGDTLFIGGCGRFFEGTPP